MQSSMSWTARGPAVRWRKPVQPLQRGALRSPLAIPTSATATIYVVAAAIYVVGHVDGSMAGFSRSEDGAGGISTRVGAPNELQEY